jgi:hypothetical protein
VGKPGGTEIRIWRAHLTDGLALLALSSSNYER